MEQENQKWVVHEEEEEEEMEDAALERRHFLSHSKDKIVTGVVASSSLPSFSSPSSSPVGNGGEHSNDNGVNNPDGTPAQKDEEISQMVSVGENGIKFNNNKVDHAAVGLGLVAEFVEAARNGEAITGASSTAARSQNENSVYFDKQEGSEVNGHNGIQNGDGAKSVPSTYHREREFEVQVQNSSIQNSPCNEVNNQCIKTVEDKIPSSSELSPLYDSSDIQAATVMNFDDETSSKEGPSLIKDINRQLKEFDIEAVLEKQETHDLFCPNCNSCITKRVILKKRKRNIHNLDNKAKRDKSDSTVSLKLVDSLAQEGNQGDQANAMPDLVSQEQPDGNCDPERESEVFRCLSCFSIFIPSGKGFNLFRNFRAAREHETSQNPSSIPESNLQNPSNAPGSNSNWFFSLFTSNKGKTANEQGDVSLEHSRTGPAEHHHSTSITSNMLASPDTSYSEGPLADTAIVKNVKPTPNIDHWHGGLNFLISSTVESVKTEPRTQNDIKSNITSGNEPLADQKCLDSLVQHGLSSGDTRTNEGEKKNDSADLLNTNNVKNMSSMSFSDETASKHESVQLATATTTEPLANTGESAKDAILKPYEGKPEVLVPSAVGPQILEKSPKDLDKTPRIIQNSFSSLRQGGDVIVFVKGVELDSATSQTADNVPVEGTIMTESPAQASIGEQPMAEIGEPQEWEILKSIVYGGLIESITSLGIVASAAGSGAAPLNIIALGLANLVGGLFILGHNLYELKNEHSGGDQHQTNDRYQELLGRRTNYLLHVVVAVLSFLIFGSIPLVIYGILISKNYYAEVKLGAVAATSIVCIILLAIGKVYTKRPAKSYIKTVLYYVSLAVSASGVSYIGGNLIKDLLQKFSHSESGFGIAMPISDTNRETAWMSY